MAIVEDAASVLEQFVQDVANVPAEIAHLLEEIAAKDRLVLECRSICHQRDSSIQKWIKLNGASTANPKEESYAKTILANYDKAQIVQEEKVGLSEKMNVLLDRQIKRLDFKIRDLQNEGALPPDPSLPSLLHTTSLPRFTPLASTTTNTTGSGTPLHPLSGNAGPSTTIANSTSNPLSRLVHNPPIILSRHPSPANLNTALPLHAPTPLSTTITASPTPYTRELSSDASKRRRLNPHAHLSIHPPTSSLRQSSLGPCSTTTPKPGTPLLTATRGSSTGPKKPPRKVAPHQRPTTLHPHPSKKPSRSRRPGKKAGGGAMGLMKASPSEDTGEESALSEVDGSQEGGEGMDGAGDAEMEEGEADDERKYCTCRSVSYGNMIACDNESCPYEWFHWSCVGMTKEPAGAWFCDTCRARMAV